jgi:hypothetical protein
VAGSCEYGDEPSGSGATELVRQLVLVFSCYVLFYILYRTLSRLVYWKFRIYYVFSAYNFRTVQ